MSNRKAKPIRIYEFNSTSFNNNGICTLFPSSSVITRDLNEHEYYLDLTHPIDDYGKWKEIAEDRIIKANGQPFRIVHVQKTMTEVIAYCEHIFYDLSNNFIEDTNIVSKNGRLAIDQILSNTVYSHGFSGTSDITTVANSRLVRKNVLEALLGDEDNSFINRWTNGNGELDIDGYSFKINNRIGQDRGYKITYGKNLTGINAKFDMKNVVTKIRPVGFDGIELNEKFVDSPYINNYAMPIIREYVYKDIKWKGSPNYQEKEDETGTVYETLAEAQAELKRRALLEFSENKIDLPSVTYDINFIELSNTEEYKDYQALSLINIGDDVTITHKKLGINIPSRCIAYKYNCLTSNFDEITLGHYNKNFFSEVKSSVSNAENILDGFDGTLNDFLQQSKDQITDYINGGFGGYVYITPNAIYIMDNPDINVAQSVMVLNQNGLGFSNTGINGTFETAITRDGHIVADFIDTGILKADLVKSGILESLNGKSWINMETGDFNLGDGKVKYENNQFQIAVSSNDISVGGSTLDEKFTEIDNKLEEITTTGGTKGDDAYSIILTNENYTFIANSDGSISSTQTVETNVLVYKGTKSISFTMSLPTIDGLTLSQSSNTITIKANSGTSLADNGSFDITIQADGQTFTKSFSWCKSRKGWDAQYVMLSGEQVFKYTDNFTGEPTPTTINIKATAYGINNPTYKWEYKQVNQAVWSTISSATSDNYDLDYDNKTIWGSDSTGIKQVSIRCTVNNTYSNIITIYKVSDGANGIDGTDGIDGINGEDGADAYTVIITNENHTFNADQNGNIAKAISTTTQIIAYKGASPITPTIGTLPSVTGLTLSKSGTTVTIQANTGTNLADSGSFNIPLTIDGKSFTKTFSWSKSKQGNKGDTGNKGSDAKTVNIMSSSQIFKSTDGGLTFTPSTITLTTTLQSVSFSKWQYSVNGGSSWIDVVSGSNGLTISNNNLIVSNDSNLYTKTNTTITFKVLTNDSNIYDTMTIVKLYDVTELDIGGRNLIINSDNGYLDDLIVYKSSDDVVYENVDGWRRISFTNQLENKEIVHDKWIIPPSLGYYTFSIECRTDGEITSSYISLYTTLHNNVIADVIKVADGHYKLVSTFNLSEYPTGYTLGTPIRVVDLKNISTSNATFIEFRYPKFERGKINTDWSKAPEDTQTEILNSINPLIETDKQLTNRLDNAFSDGVITSYEKIQIASDLKEIDAQYDDITRIVNLYNEEIITGSYNEYKTSYDNLHTILDTILSSMDEDTEYSVTVVKEAFYLYGVNYSHLRASLDNYIKDNFDTTKTTITTLSDNVDIAITKSSSNEQNLNTITKHMKFSDEGWLELFATNNDEEGRFKTRITDTKLSFTDNNNEVAFMSNQQLFINHAQIVNELKIGNIVITKSDTGGIIFRWDE